LKRFIVLFSFKFFIVEILFLISFSFSLQNKISSTFTASKLISESTAFEAATLSAAFASFLNFVLHAVVVTVKAV
jgi:hypothetical protein